MKSAEKKIIFISVVALLAVVVWAGVVNINKSNNSLSSTINLGQIKNTITQNEGASNSSEEVNNSTGTNNSTQSSNSTGESSQTVVKMKSNDQGVPVIMYHSVSDDKVAAGSKLTNLRITRESFLEQMEYLKNNKFTTLTMDELRDFLINNKQIPEKSVVLTFDDGYEDNYTIVYPILKQYGFKATIFVETSNVDVDKSMLTSAQLIDLDKNNVDIESGTAQDNNLGTLSSTSQLKSLQNSKQYLEKLLNKTVNYVSYPYGSYNNSTLDASNKAGYVLGLSRDGKWTYKTDGNYKLSRVFIGPKHTIDNFSERLNNPNYN